MGACAEFGAANELLLNNPNLKLKDIQFTQAVRPRNGKPVRLVVKIAQTYLELKNNEND